MLPSNYTIFDVNRGNILLNGAAVAAILAGSPSVGQLALPESNTALATVGAGVLTAAAILGGIITRTGPVAAFTDTTSTAALIQDAWTGGVGNSFELTIKNTTAFAQTLAAGTGVTLSGVTIIPPNSVGRYVLIWTGADTISMLGLMVVPLTTSPLRITTGLTTNGAGTITAAGIAGGTTLRSVPTVAFTDTTDTAAAIIAALPNANVGQSFEWLYRNNTGVQATLAGGVGATVSGITIVPRNSWARFLVTYSAAGAVTLVGIELGQNASLPDVALTALNATTGSLPAGAITGAKQVTMVTSNATPGAQLVRSAANMLADTPNAQIGTKWGLRITNTGAGTLTLTADGGATVTLVGTMTVPQNTFRDFICSIDTATTATITAVGTGTYS